MLQIAVDARVVQDRYHGIGRHALELLRAMSARRQAKLVVLRGRASDARLSVDELTGASGVRFVEFDARPASLGEQVRWHSVLQRILPDVLLVPYHLATPWLSPVPVVTIIHDCIFESDPSFAPANVRRLYRLATRLAIARATAVVTVSEATRRSLQEHYGLVVPPDNVVHHGVDRRFSRACSAPDLASARARLGLPERYVLSVGVRRPHKNQVTLVRAFGALTNLEPSVDLVLVGAADKRFPDPVPPLIESLGLGQRIHLVPEVPEELLPAVYQGAAAFALPSLIEGFGLPLQEAMAAGVPAVASATPALAEVAAGAALLVPPLDIEAWAASLRRILQEGPLAQRLRREGRLIAQSRTWDAAAGRMLDLLGCTAAAATPLLPRLSIRRWRAHGGDEG